MRPLRCRWHAERIARRASPAPDLRALAPRRATPRGADRKILQARGSTYDAAFLLDPDGHDVEAVHLG
jgi:hypothetical protein